MVARTADWMVGLRAGSTADLTVAQMARRKAATKVGSTVT